MTTTSTSSGASPRASTDPPHESIVGGSGYGPSTVVEWFAQGADAHPSRIALRCGGRELTYAELDRRSLQVAAMLTSHGVQPSDLVAVRVGRSVDLVIALLGVLRAGCAYVPLDPLYPGDRQSAILTDTGARVAVVSERSSTPRRGVRELEIDTADSFEPGTETPPASGDLAYVIYTSGSTGVPKGVAIEHRSVVNLLRAFGEISAISETDTLLSVTTVLFDIAVLELFLPLGVGAAVAIAAEDPGHDPDALLCEMETLRPTIMQGTPTLWRMLCLLEAWSDPALTILCGGEQLAGDLAAELARRCGRLFNVYGPTETTIWSTVDRLYGAGDTALQPTVSIGRAISDTCLAIDTGHSEGQRSLHRFPCDDEIGELLISGAGLARGYWNREELTAERFEWIDGTRWYRTGDLARWLPDGRMECLGRTDHQVKIRGHRIELGEIEHVLRRHDAISDAVVVTDDHDRLVAYVVTSGRPTAISGDVDLREHVDLREYAARSLPLYMVPDAIVHLEAVPVTPSGKVDRGALSSLGAVRRGTTQPCSTTST